MLFSKHFVLNRQQFVDVLLVGKQVYVVSTLLGGMPTNSPTAAINYNA